MIITLDQLDNVVVNWNIDRTFHWLSLNHTEYFEKILGGSVQIPGQVVECIYLPLIDSHLAIIQKASVKLEFFVFFINIKTWFNHLKFKGSPPTPIQKSMFCCLFWEGQHPALDLHPNLEAF